MVIVDEVRQNVHEYDLLDQKRDALPSPKSQGESSRQKEQEISQEICLRGCSEKVSGGGEAIPWSPSGKYPIHSAERSRIGAKKKLWMGG